MITSASVRAEAPLKPDFAKMVHIIIGLLIMVSGYFLPQISQSCVWSSAG